MITLEQIFRDYQTQVFNHALRVVKNHHDAEDVAMNVFIKIQKLNDKDSTRFDENKSSLSTWVHTVTNSVILDFFRTNHQDKYKAVSEFVDSEGKEIFTFVAPESTRADSEVLTSELHSKIADAFRTLKPKYRKIAILYFLRGREYSEIADIMNVPMGTVKGMLSRSRAKLQESLQGVYKLNPVKTEMSEA